RPPARRSPPAGRPALRASLARLSLRRATCHRASFRPKSTGAGARHGGHLGPPRGDVMPSDVAALLAVVILAFPMVCFFLSAPAFLLVGLEVPEPTQLLRAIIRGYFLAIGIAGTIAMVLLVAAGRPVFAIGAVAIAASAIAVRRWLLQRVDAQLRARDA